MSYTADSNGIVSRDGQPVAFYKDGQITYLGDGKTFARFIKKTLADAGFAVSGEKPAEQEHVTILAAPVEPFPHHPLNDKYPGSPAIDPAAGDKTPAFVDWLFEHHPDDAAERYVNRITHRI